MNKRKEETLERLLAEKEAEKKAEAEHIRWCNAHKDVVRDLVQKWNKVPERKAAKPEWFGSEDGMA